MSADLLRRAATVLRDPDRCNTNAHDRPLADVLRDAAPLAAADEYRAAVASDHVFSGVPTTYSPLVAGLITVARAILGETA